MNIGHMCWAAILICGTAVVCAGLIALLVLCIKGIINAIFSSSFIKDK